MFWEWLVGGAVAVIVMGILNTQKFTRETVVLLQRVLEQGERQEKMLKKIEERIIELNHRHWRHLLAQGFNEDVLDRAAREDLFRDREID